MVAQKLQPKTCSSKKLINIGVVYDYFDSRHKQNKKDTRFTWSMACKDMKIDCIMCLHVYIIKNYYYSTSYCLQQ